MAYRAKKTQKPSEGGCLIQFELEDHPDKPVLECDTSDFANGQQIMERFKQWADEHGGARLVK